MNNWLAAIEVAAAKTGRAKGKRKKLETAMKIGCVYVLYTIYQPTHNTDSSHNGTSCHNTTKY